MSESIANKALGGDSGPGLDPAPTLDDATVSQLLRRGTRAASASSGGSSEESTEKLQTVLQLVQGGKYSGLADPVGAELLGRELARLLAPVRPDVLLVWQDVEDVVLGYVVARVLNVSMIRAYDAEGIVGCSGEIRRGARAVAVTDAVREPTVVRALRSVVERSGGELVAVGTLVASPLAPADVQLVVLAGDGDAHQDGVPSVGEGGGAR